MAELQRSALSFRRQGSSGLVWEDRLLSADHSNQANKKEEKAEAGQVEFRQRRPSQSVGSTGVMKCSRSDGVERGWPTDKGTPSIDPPSPKVSSCGLCGVFGKPTNSKQHNKSYKR